MAEVIVFMLTQMDGQAGLLLHELMGPPILGVTSTKKKELFQLFFFDLDAVAISIWQFFFLAVLSMLHMPKKVEEEKKR